MKNKITSVSGCLVLISENNEFFKSIDCLEAKKIVEEMTATESKWNYLQLSGESSMVLKFCALIKEGKDEEGMKIIAGCLKKCGSRIDELLCLDITSNRNKSWVQLLVLDIVLWGNAAMNLLERWSLYKATGLFHEPKFKK